MKAIRQIELGAPDVLQLVDLPTPEPRPTEVLVRVVSAGVNPVDWKTRAKGGFLGEPPFTVGWDVAGVVEQVGYGVTRFSAGDRVFGMPWFPREAGAYAEYVTAPSRHFARLPDGFELRDAGAIALGALTAWQALVETAGVGSGTRVLIHAAGGGVGHLAVQIAKARGAYVIGTARAKHHDFLRELGVDETLDYTTVDVGETADEIDVVLDLVGGDTGRASLPAVRDGGLVINIPSGADIEALRAAAGERVRVAALLVEPDSAAIDAIAALLAAGKLRVKIARAFALSDAARAHELGERGEIGGGKIVLLPDS
jgi:NADPH:quinone reductase-like Zn-dependent oxidoreductase